MRILVYALWLGAIIPAAGAEAPPAGLYLGLDGLYGTFSRFSRVREFGAALEVPLKRGFSTVLRLQYRRIRQVDSYLPGQEDERSDNVYANGFPATYRIAACQATLRRHPWEWMPGFYAEALAGYKRIDGRDEGTSSPWAAEALGGEGGTRPWPYTNHAFQTGLGFGYAWEWARMRCVAGFLFGPELLIRNSVQEGGERRSSGEILDLLRFNQLELGYSF